MRRNNIFSVTGRQSRAGANVGAGPVSARTPVTAYVVGLFPGILSRRFALSGKRAGTGPAPTVATDEYLYNTTPHKYPAKTTEI